MTYTRNQPDFVEPCPNLLSLSWIRKFPSGTSCGPWQNGGHDTTRGQRAADCSVGTRPATCSKAALPVVKFWECAAFALVLMTRCFKGRTLA
ncbi:hypothetical protein NPIL_522551 [Nephila pilipes]|uniref:Uncharacterized protein n=1 Tax=Nephila pilipes TaxID=299642 RepID=A0A8X6QK64_NEPPI|nr:hypothetical protein NPIL_522551 [Nephila pilipes]